MHLRKSSAKGSISVSNSAFRDIPQGLIFLATSESPATALVTISSCSFTRISSPSNQLTSFLACATATTLVIDHVEVWNCLLSAAVS